MVLPKLVRNIIFKCERRFILFWWAFERLTFLSGVRGLLCKPAFILITCVWLLLLLTLKIRFVVIGPLFVFILGFIRLIIVRKIVDWWWCKLIIHFILYSITIPLINSFSLFHIHIHCKWIFCIGIFLFVHKVINFWLIFVIWNLWFIVLILSAKHIEISTCSLSVICFRWAWISECYFLWTKFVVIW